MPRALAVLWSVLRDEELANERKQELAIEFDQVLGLGIKHFGKEEIPAEIIFLAKERGLARSNKDFRRSDALRNEISARGYVIDDKKDGSYSIRKA